MKAIYKEARALAYPLEVQHKAGRAFTTGSFRANLREALRVFERVNRSVRHNFDAPYLQLCAKTTEYPSPAEHAQRKKMFESLTGLVKALQEGQHPNAAQLLPLLRAQDTSGWLENYASRTFLNLIKHSTQLKLSDAFSVYGFLRFEDDKIHLHLKISAARTDGYEEFEDAERLVVLDIDGRTLGGVSQLEKVARKKLKELFNTAEQWPEFEGYSPRSY